MISSRKQIELIAGSLILLGVGLMLYKVLYLGFPLLPGEYREVWTIESKISFKPGEGPVEVELVLPEGQAGWVLLEEHFASSGFGFSVHDSINQRKALWTRKNLERATTLHYKIQAYRPSQAGLPDNAPPPVKPPLLEDNQLMVMERLITVLEEKSSSPESFTDLLLQALGRSSTDENARFLLSTWEEEPVTVVLAVLAQAGIPARELRGLRLEDGRRRQTLSSLLEIHNGKQWIIFDPESRQRGLSNDFFYLATWRRCHSWCHRCAAIQT